MLRNDGAFSSPFRGCDNCEEWFHGDCVGITEKDAKLIKNYYCFQCIRKSSLRIPFPSFLPSFSFIPFLALPFFPFYPSGRNPRLSIVRKTAEPVVKSKKRRTSTTEASLPQKKRMRPEKANRPKPSSNHPAFLDSDADDSEDIDVGDEKDLFGRDRLPLKPPKPAGAMKIKRKAYKLCLFSRTTRKCLFRVLVLSIHAYFKV